MATMKNINAAFLRRSTYADKISVIRKYRVLDLHNKPIKLNGQTWYQWATELFKWENCSECGKGVRGHEPRILAGNWFAKCKYLHGDAPLS